MSLRAFSCRPALPPRPRVLCAPDLAAGVLAAVAAGLRALDLAAGVLAAAAAAAIGLLRDFLLAAGLLNADPFLDAEAAAARPPSHTTAVIPRPGRRSSKVLRLDATGGAGTLSVPAAQARGCLEMRPATQRPISSTWSRPRWSGRPGSLLVVFFMDRNSAPSIPGACWRAASIEPAA